MGLRCPVVSLVRAFALICIFGAMESTLVDAETMVQSSRPVTSECRIQAVDYKGWDAQQLSNQWVQLMVVPQNGGRLMQVSFAGHSYLFVNRKYAGKYLPPTPGKWFNYGGDKLWLLPEGNNDEQHWAGGSDIVMHVDYRDSSTGEIIANPDFWKGNNAWSGGGSMGQTDNQIRDGVVAQIVLYTATNK